MKRFKNILVYLPELEGHTRALDWCAMIAGRAHPERVEIVHYVETGFSDLPGGTPLHEVLEGATARLDELAAEQLPGRPVAVSASGEDPLRALLGLLAKGEYDLLILPVDGKASRSLAERLARKSPVGVLAVPPGAKPRLRRCRVAVDFSDLSPLALEWAEAFSTLATEKPALEALHVMKMPDGALSKMAIDPAHLRGHIYDVSLASLKKFVAEHAVAPDGWDVAVEEHGLAWIQILAEQRGKPLDLLVVGSHGQGVLPIALLGSQSSEIIRETVRPVLVVKRKNQTLNFLRQLVGLEPPRP